MDYDVLIDAWGYLDELLTYDPTDYSEFELKNILAIMDLFKKEGYATL